MTTEKPKVKRVSIIFTERELYLLDNGFSTSYERDEDDPDCVELGKITDKLHSASRRLK